MVLRIFAGIPTNNCIIWTIFWYHSTAAYHGNFLPIVTPAKTMAPAPIHAFFFIKIGLASIFLFGFWTKGCVFSDQTSLWSDQHMMLDLLIPPSIQKGTAMIDENNPFIFVNFPKLVVKGGKSVTDSCNSWPVICLEDLLPRRFSCLEELSWATNKGFLNKGNLITPKKLDWFYCE